MVRNIFLIRAFWLCASSLLYHCLCLLTLSSSSLPHKILDDGKLKLAQVTGDQKKKQQLKTSHYLLKKINSHDMNDIQSLQLTVMNTLMDFACDIFSFDDKDKTLKVLKKTTMILTVS